MMLMKNYIYIVKRIDNYRQDMAAFLPALHNAWRKRNRMEENNMTEPYKMFTVYCKISKCCLLNEKGESTFENDGRMCFGCCYSVIKRDE